MSPTQTRTRLAKTIFASHLLAWFFFGILIGMFLRMLTRTVPGVPQNDTFWIVVTGGLSAGVAAFIAYRALIRSDYVLRKTEVVTLQYPCPERDLYPLEIRSANKRSRLIVLEQDAITLYSFGKVRRILWEEVVSCLLVFERSAFGDDLPPRVRFLGADNRLLGEASLAKASIADRERCLYRIKEWFAQETNDAGETSLSPGIVPSVRTVRPSDAPDSVLLKQKSR